MSKGLLDVRVTGVEPVHQGKVRSVYEAGEHLLIVATDRISAYDSVLPTAIPDKGRILTQLSAFWFRQLSAVRPHHMVSVDLDDFPEPFRSEPSLAGRSTLCVRAEPLPVECIVRGYLAGSGYREYKEKGTLNGEPLPKGLHEGSALRPARFTPTTKATSGHDAPLTLDEFKDVLGEELAKQLEKRSLAIYNEAAPICEAAGLVLADTKFEFGRAGDRILLIDECLSPDASRFWDSEAHAKGNLESFDKQYVRDYLDEAGWNHEPPAPKLPAKVVRATRDRYLEAARRLLGDEEFAEAGLAEESRA